MENKGCCPVTPDAGGSPEKKSGCGMKSCCGATMIKGTLVGGIVIFVIITASRTLLPMHKTLMTSLTNEGLLAMTLIKLLGLCLAGGALLTLLLKKTAGGCCPVFYSLVVGLLIALFAHVPNMIFYHADIRFTLPSMLEIFLATALAGLSIAQFVLKRGKCGPGKCCPESGGEKKGCS